MPDLRLIPCNRQDKRPLVSDWPNKASSDPAQQESWEAEFPGCLWGALCGEVFDVLDVDPAGIGWALEHEDELRTYAQLTRRRGLHLYFQPTLGLRTRRSCPVPGVDVRSTGSFAIDWKREGLPTIERAMLKMPEWIVEAIMTSPKRIEKHKNGPPVGGSNFLPKSIYLKLCRLMPAGRNQRRVRGILSSMVTSKTSDRNDGLNDAAFTLRPFVAEGLLSRDAAEGLLFEAACWNGYVEKDGEKAALATIRSGLGDGSDT